MVILPLFLMPLWQDYNFLNLHFVFLRLLFLLPKLNYQLDFLRENFISVQKIEEKMQKDIKANEHIILGGRRNGKTLEYGKRLGRIEMCKELLESEE